MRVLLATNFFYPKYGGIETHVEGLARTLRRYGHEVFVVTTTGKTGVENYQGLKVFRISMDPVIPIFIGANFFKRRLIKIFRLIDPDIVHVHHAFSYLGIFGSEIAEAIGKPSVLTNHSIPPFYSVVKPFWNTVIKAFSIHKPYSNWRKYDFIINVSKIATEFFSHAFPKRMTVIPNAIDLSEFRIKASKKDLGIDEDVPLVLSVGRSSLKKGFNKAIYAFQYVVKAIPTARLYIVGPTGTYVSVLSRLAKMLEIENNVYFPGFVPRETLIKFYKAADVFLHPAYGGESFGIVLLEAMASGTPIVATHGDGLKELLQLSGAGICVESGDPEKISKAIIKLLRNPELREKLGRNGKIFAMKFSWDSVIRKILGVYREVIG